MRGGGAGHRVPGGHAEPGKASARGASTTASPHASAADGAEPAAPKWTRTFTPTTVTLFQFSALTYNGHRIHYDHPYATGTEGYPGLLVHGPLTALLLLDAARRHGEAPVSSFRYRALAPLFADQPITLVGRRGPERVVEALDPSGAVAMRGWVG